MVKVKEDTQNLDGVIDVMPWLANIQHKSRFKDTILLQHACNLAQLSGDEYATETGQSCLQQGLAMADLLADLGASQETLAAAIIFVVAHYADLALEDIEEQLTGHIAKLVIGVEKMNVLCNLKSSSHYQQTKHQLDNIKKMLLAMVDDARVVLIKLAERLCVLRNAQQLPLTLQKQVATEAMDIYAPLANRLGIGAIKWEMEDLAFRYLHPAEYQEIARGLNAKRLARDQYVSMIVDELNAQINALGVPHFSVYGRSKHIHSIYRKMQRKNVSLNEIYDATAVRILVETVEQCYEVLEMVHVLWERVPAEFDDYIVNTKANGYQSLHTAVVGPKARVFEVQIRTFKMHELAEMGMAAHWKYKEGARAQQESHERKIEWLRDVLAWHHEMASKHGMDETIETKFIEDRVYVFTPEGDVLDLPEGVTPIDFAYHIHSQVVHRCRGAKVNGHIVPLTYRLKTGDSIEILTGKDIRPSRDWLNPHLNYLKTSRAKAKVLHWFKMQDFDKNKTAGQELLDKELKSLNIKLEQTDALLASFNLKRFDDLLAGLGRGDIKLSQVIQRLAPANYLTQTPSTKVSLQPLPKMTACDEDIEIEGVGQLLTNMARCCQPVPGDKVIGYITLGRGVSIHRQDCSNILHATLKQQQRFIQVSWGNAIRRHYIVDVVIKAFDRSDLLKDITSLLANEKARVYALQTDTNQKENITYMTVKLEVEGLNALSTLFNKLTNIQNVLEVQRKVG